MRPGVTFDPAAWGSINPSHYTDPSRTIGPCRVLIVHHTATSQPSDPSRGPALVASLERFGYARDGAAVEYHALIDQYGQVYEGFAPKIRGAHCIAYDAHTGQNFNMSAMGAAWIGYFAAPVNHVPTPEQREAYARWVAERVLDGSLSAEVMDPGPGGGLPGYYPHRAVDATACPGTIIDVLASVMARAKELVAAGPGLPANPFPPVPPPVAWPPGIPVPTLQQGSQGAEVVKLQQALVARGMYPGQLDGDFGPMTLAGVKLLQTRLGVAADGIYGDKTATALMVSGPTPPPAPIPPPAPAPAPTPAPPPQPVRPAPNMRHVLFYAPTHMKGADVRYLQRALIAAGFGLPMFGADGDLGNETNNAIMNFQRAHGLLVDGKVGVNTWTAVDVIADSHAVIWGAA